MVSLWSARERLTAICLGKLCSHLCHLTFRVPVSSASHAISHSTQNDTNTSIPELRVRQIQGVRRYLQVWGEFLSYAGLISIQEKIQWARHISCSTLTQVDLILLHFHGNAASYHPSSLRNNCSWNSLYSSPWSCCGVSTSPRTSSLHSSSKSSWLVWVRSMCVVSISWYVQLQVLPDSQYLVARQF